jgi:BASS family bile acid:Na+ symporter
MGLTVNINQFKDVLRKPQWIFITVLLQYSVMPILAYFIAKFLNLSNEMSLGFIILGSCPGGTASNVITYLINGNVPLSLMCTLTSTILSILLTPYLILFLADKSINIDLISLMYSTSKIILIPLILGLFVRIYFFKFVDRIKFLFPIISELTIALVIAVIFAINSESLKILNTTILLGVILHNIGGLLIGYFVARFLTLSNASIKTISIEVGMQNSGLAMALSVMHFSKVVAFPAALFSLWHNISASVLVYLSKKK